MGLVDSLKARGTQFASQAVAKVFEDEKRAEQIGELLVKIQRGRKALDGAQEAALKNLGIASSGEVKAAGKRLAQLRKSARQLDEKLSALAGKLEAGAGSESAGS